MAVKAAFSVYSLHIYIILLTTGQTVKCSINKQNTFLSAVGTEHLKITLDLCNV